MLLDSIGEYLAAQGVTGVGWPLCLSFMPDDSDQAVALFETGGFPPDTLNRETERVTFQLRVRGGRLDYQVVRAKWKQAFDALQDADQTLGSPVLLPGIAYIQSMHFGPLAFNDEKGRTNMTSNFRVYQTRS